MVKIEAGTGQGSFKINGKPYQKGQYELVIEVNDVISICRTSKHGELIVSKTPLPDWRDSANNPFANITDFITYLETLFFLANSVTSSGVSYTYVAANYTDLSTVVAPAPPEPFGTLAYVYASQGTQWLPGTIGGTYYPQGIYVWTNTGWVSDRNNIAAAFADVFNGIDINEKMLGIVDGINATYTSTLPFLPASVIVMVNGLAQRKLTDYNNIGNNTIAFTTSPEVGDYLSIHYQKQL